MESPYHLRLIQLFSEAKSMLIALFVILYCVLRWKRNSTASKGEQPPQPSKNWPIIGHLHLLKGLPHITLGELADQCGPIFMIRLGARQALVVSTSEMAKECLGGTNDKVFLNRLHHTVFVEHMTYDSAMFAFSPYGQYWRELRKITTVELLSNPRLEMFRNVRISAIRSAMTELSGVGSEPIDMKQRFNDISVNTIVRLVAGKSLKEFYQGEEYNEQTKVISDFFEMAGAFIPADALPILRWFDVGGFVKKMKKVAKQVDHLAQRWLEEHKEHRSSSKENRDFMDVLLGIYESGQEMPSDFDADTIIKASCMQMILAASDTTAVTLTWTLSLLLNNKEVLKKTQAELDAVVGKGRLVEESDLKNLVYLQSVIKESMRLYPAGPLSVPRESTTDCTVSGYHIPAGTQLFVNLYKIHRDPQVWEDPLNFIPERFLITHSGKDYDFRGQNTEFMPFGSGRRICPGISYALLAIQFTLANLLHGFEIKAPLDETIDMTEGFGLTIQKVTPLKVILTQRIPYQLFLSHLQ